MLLDTSQLQGTMQNINIAQRGTRSLQANQTQSCFFVSGPKVAERPNMVYTGTGRATHAMYGRCSAGVDISCVKHRTWKATGMHSIHRLHYNALSHSKREHAVRFLTDSHV